VSTSRIDDIPIGLGEASCDAKLRFRLKSGWPNYFLRENRTVCDLFVATLDHQTITVFERQDFIRLRSHLTRIKDPDGLLPRYIEWGGEAQLDYQGRFVLPGRVRKCLNYDPAKQDFTILCALPVTLVPQEQHAEEAAKLTFGPEIRRLGDSAFSDCLVLEESR